MTKPDAARACYGQTDPFWSLNPMPPAPATPKRIRFGDQIRCRSRLLRSNGTVLITKPNAACACYAQMQPKRSRFGYQNQTARACYALRWPKMVPR